MGSSHDLLVKFNKWSVAAILSAFNIFDQAILKKHSLHL